MPAETVPNLQTREADGEEPRPRSELKVILGALDDAVVAMDRHGNKVFANEAAARIFGFPDPESLMATSREEFLGRFDILDAAMRFCDPESCPPARALRGEAVAGEVACYREKATGRESWLVVKATPVLDELGEVALVIAIFSDITSVKQAQEAVRLTEGRLSLIFNNVSDQVTLLAVEQDGFRVLLANPAALAMSPVSPERMLGQRLESFLDAEQLLNWRPLLWQVSLTGQVQVVEREVNIHNRRPIFETRLTPLLDDVGHCTHILSVVRDVTSRRAAEDLRRKHMRYLEEMEAVARIIEKAADAESALPAVLARLLETFACDRAWLVYPADLDALSYRVPISMARPGLAAFPSHEDLPPASPIRALIRMVLSQDEPLALGRNSPLPKAGSWRKAYGAEAALSMLLRPTGGKPWLFLMLAESPQAAWDADELALFRSMGSRIGAALASLLLYRDLRRSEEKYRTLFERSLDGIYRCAADGTVLDANPALVEMLGYTRRRELVGRVQAQLLPAGGRVEGLPERGEAFVIDLRRRDGTSLWAEVGSRPVRRMGGEVAFFEGIVRNIDDRKRAEEALQASEESLRQSQKMEAVGRLAGGVAHDFNNLLTAINGFGDLLLMSVPPEDPRRAHVEEIRKAGERAAALTSQLLSFSRKQVMSLQPVDLNAVVLGMEAMLRRLIGEHIDFRLRLDPLLAKVAADPNQVEQIILNLCVNARDAMPQGGELEVSTGNTRLLGNEPSLGAPAGEYAVLTVNDTGMGMDEETRARLFEPFFTTKPKDQGTGLGLSMVYGAVKQLRGSVSVNSASGQGTLFHIYLPVLPEGQVTCPPVIRDSAHPAAAHPAYAESKTILLVEDEDAVRRLVRDVLLAQGFLVMDAPSGQRALEVSAGHSGEIDLLLTDVVMGGMSGRELAERLSLVRPNTKILYMSGYTEDAIIRHGVMAAHTAFISKPFRPLALVSKVREVLGGALEDANKEASEA